MENNYYEMLDNFMVRTPNLPTNSYLDVFEEKVNIDKIINTPGFCEAVLIASPSLYETIKKYRNGEFIKKKDQFIASLVKYYIRMTTRPTPFGNFSSSSMGRFGEETLVNYNTTNNKKRLRVDFQWLVEVIKEFEGNDNVFKELKLFSNNLLMYEGEKIKNQFLTCFNDEKSNQLNKKYSYINNTPNIRYILDNTNKGIMFKNLVDLFKSKDCRFDMEVIAKCVKELIKKEFVHTELRPSLTDFDYLNTLIKKMEKREIKNEKLDGIKKISELINKYNNSIDCENEYLILEILKLMSQVKINENYIQVDCSSGIDIMLKNNIRNDLNAAMNLFIDFSYLSKTDSNIKRFTDKFINEYGDYAEVKITNFINSSSKIAYRKDIPTDMAGNKSERERVQSEFIENKIIDAIANNNDIVISDEEIKLFKNPNINKNDLIDSLELYCCLSAENLDAVNEGNYEITISANVGSNGAGKTFGRFSDIIPNVDEFYNEIKLKENYLLDSDVIKCELVALNSDARSTNVTISKNFRDYQVNIYNEKDKEKVNIDIEDIYIGSENEKLYLKSKSLNKRLNITTNHMLNNGVVNTLAEIMREISGTNEKITPFLFIGSISKINYNYVPRIRYKNVTIIPKTWNINKEIIISYNNNMDNAIDIFLKRYKVTRYIYMVDGDNKLLLDLYLKEHKEILCKEIKKDSVSILRLQEVESHIIKNWIKISEKSYIGEFVFQFISKKENKIKKSTSDELSYLTLSDFTNRKIKFDNVGWRFNVLDDWLYLKLYINNERADEIIGVNMKKLCDVLYKENLIANHFFIRYLDENEHLRLRFKINSDDIKMKLYKIINDWCNDLYNKKLLNNVTIDCYEREIERYGGICTIDAAEELFEVQSLMIEKYFSLNIVNKLNIDKIEFGVINIIYLMDKLGIDFLAKLEIMNKRVDKEYFRKEFGVLRKRYINICNYSNEWQGLRSSAIGREIYNLINIQKESIEKFKINLDNTDKLGLLTNSKIDILFSITHMLCNRLYGIDRKKEKEVIALTRHTLHSLKYFINRN